MSNYCSVGLDAKIGLRFEKNRTKSRFLNKLMYFVEGVKRLAARQERLKSYVDKFEILSSINPEHSYLYDNSKASLYNEEKTHHNDIFPLSPNKNKFKLGDYHKEEDGYINDQEQDDNDDA